MKKLLNKKTIGFVLAAVAAIGGTVFGVKKVQEHKALECKDEQ